MDPKLHPAVSDFEFAKISNSHNAYGATTAARSAAHNRKDLRFSLNPLLKDHLSVEEEENRLIDGKVQARVGAIVEEARAKGRTEGYEEGLKKGFSEAFGQFKMDGTARLAQFESLVGELESAKNQLFKANERFLVDLVFRVSRMILLKDLSVDREYVLRVAKEIIERMGVRDNIRIKLHPDAIETAGMLKEGLEAQLGTLKNLSIESSAQVRLGGCQIETEWSSIDASIDTQLKGIQDAMGLGSTGT